MQGETFCVRYLHLRLQSVCATVNRVAPTVSDVYDQRLSSVCDALSNASGVRGDRRQEKDLECSQHCSTNKLLIISFIMPFHVQQNNFEMKDAGERPAGALQVGASERTSDRWKQQVVSIPGWQMNTVTELDR